MIQKLVEASSFAVNVTFQPTQLLPVLLSVVLETGFSSSTACAQQGKSLAESRAAPYPQLPENVERQAVTIWSDGTKMAGDVYRPKNLKPEDKLPAIVFVHGTGGVKKAGFSVRLATAFAQRGYVFLNFDYRGWGESDSKLLMLSEMPEPDEKGQLTVKVRAIRWQMDFQDQTTDIRSAIAFMSGEPNVDPQRIGVLGTSYGGGLTTWAAAYDPRVKCAAVQVPGMGGGRGQPYYQNAYGLMTRQARGETEPVPYEQGAPTGKMAAYAHMRYNPAKDVAYDAIRAARDVKIPMLIIDAEQEELMDITKNGARVAEILRANGTEVKYHVLSGIGHYGVYGDKFQEALGLELDWFNMHLKKNEP
jgi:dipeptidyl aminopeptidase/acylaminoacyl peptidase